MNIASKGSCVTIKTEMLECWSKCNVSSLTSSLRLRSKLEKGSSSNNKSGWAIIDLANATRCCSPPLSSWGYLLRELDNLTILIVFL